MGRSRATVIGLHTEFDHVLSVVAPIGLAAAAARPALVIDLDPDGPAYSRVRGHWPNWSTRVRPDLELFPACPVRHGSERRVAPKRRHRLGAGRFR